MKSNSKVCINKKVVWLSLAVAFLLAVLYSFTNLANTKKSYQSRASEIKYIAQHDQTTGHTYISDGVGSVLTVVQHPKNWEEAQGWSMFIPWTGIDPRKPDAPGGVCYLRINGEDISTKLTFEYVNGFKVNSTTLATSKVMPDGTEKCLFDHKTANTLIVHSGKVIGVIPPPLYVQKIIDKRIKASVLWHSQGRPSNLDRPLGSFTVITHDFDGVESSYIGKLTLGYQVSL